MKKDYRFIVGYLLFMSGIIIYAIKFFININQTILDGFIKYPYLTFPSIILCLLGFILMGKAIIDVKKK